jgi:uncharacterized iron-regulated membrane protein
MHLVAGVVAGVVIAVMCFTGVALAFEKEIVAWADRDVRVVTPGAAPSAFSVEDAFAKVASAHPKIKPTAATISMDPAVGVLVSVGRTNAFYVNQYTGAVSAPASPRMRAFMNTMIEWHRWLAQSGDDRARGKMITGACNFAFLFLAASGMYLWWPRKWNALALRGILIFNRGLVGKARDWNWHNVIGIWSAPVLVVLTATALPISYKWAGDAIYKLTKTEAPPPPNAARAASNESERKKEPAASSPTIASILETVRNEVPNAAQVTVRPGGRGPVALTVKEQKPRPRFATIQLTLDAKSGAVTKKETYGDFNAGRKVRSWTRFLHTGEALGPAGQVIAGGASFGGLVLVWTGFALAIRRFFGKKTRATQETVREVEVAEVSK